MRTIEIVPLLRYGRGFTALDPGRRTAVLRLLQDAPLVLLRRGFWGLRTLVLMGYYARPAAAAAIGYRADPRGLGGAPVTEADYDVVIVGSGAGGGTVAQGLIPLVRDGRRVLVLEQGPRLDDHEFTGREAEMADARSTRTAAAS